MRNIQQDIKNKTFRRVYLLYGDEAYLIREYKRILIEAISGGDTMNLMISEEGVPDINQVDNFIQTFPMFSDYRLVVINDSGLFAKAAEGWDDIIKNVPETAVIIFAEKKVDKRLALYKAVSKLDSHHGYICEMNAPDETTIQKFVLTRLKNAGKKISQNTYDELIRREGESMENLSSELEKLIAFVGDKDIITIEDIESICSPHPSDQVFLMIDAALDGNQKKAMELYNDLLTLRVPAAKTLALLGRQCNQLYLASTMAGQGQNLIASTLKIPPFAAKKLIQKCGRSSSDRLLKMVEQCVEHEYMVKSGRMEDTLAVERLIVMISMRN